MLKNDPVEYLEKLGQEHREGEGMKVNFAVIGTNMITDRFIKAAKKTEEFCLKGVYSRSMERALEYGGKYGAQLFFDNLEDLAASSQIDAVYVASPNCCHAKQSIRMMEAHKHVLCEKPVASNVREFQAMEDAALKNQVIFMEAMRNVYTPGFRAVKENLYKLGKIRRATLQYCQYSSRYDNFKKGIIENAFKPELSNGALMDIGSYCVHFMAALFGKPESIQSCSLKLSNGADGAGTILAQYQGMQAELIYSKITDSRLPSQIQGEEGSMVIQEVSNPRKAVIYSRRGEQEVLEISSIDTDMTYEIREFLRLIQEKQYDHPYLRNSRLEMEIIDQVRRQQGIIFPADREEL